VALDFFWPIQRSREIDDVDYFGTFDETATGVLEGDTSSVEGRERVLASEKV
jgi:hypothetical protein